MENTNEPSLSEITERFSSLFTNGNSNFPSGNPNTYTLFPTNQDDQHDQVNTILKQQMSASILALGGIRPAWAMTELGSNYLRELLKDGEPLVKHYIFQGVLHSLFEFMKHTHAHRVFKKLLDVCSETSKDMIVMRLSQDRTKLLELAMDPCGRESLTKFVMIMKRSPTLNLVTRVLASGVSDLMIAGKGSSLVNYCLCTLSYEHKLIMFEDIMKKFHIVARHEVGCIWLKKLMEELTGTERTMLLNEVIRNCRGLSRDPYGNFVVLHALKLEDPSIDEGICSNIKEDMEELSIMKSGSYVVEKCLKSSAGKLLLEELANIKLKDVEKIARNSYGNYVIQTAIQVLNKGDELRNKLKFVIAGINRPWFRTSQTS